MRRRNVRLTILTFGFSDDGLSDEALEGMHAVTLPNPELANMQDIETMMRMANGTAQGRDSLTKFVVSADYISKLVPLVEMSEKLEDLQSLHRLCNIMKTLILLNDTAIIEFIVNDDIILGVVGALECMHCYL
jgi:protein phosphatase 4 regulatory subunit 3